MGVLRGRSLREGRVSIRSFYLVSSHGAVLFYVAANPHCSVDDITEGLFLTHRTVWGLIGDLRRAGLLHVRKEGRRNRYAVNLDAPFLHPSLEGYTLRNVLGDPPMRSLSALAQPG